MRIQVALVVVLAGVAALVRPSPAEACSCGGTLSSSAAFANADLVFVGTVTRLSGGLNFSTRVNPDGSISVEPRTEPPVAIFEVAHMFRGSATPQIVVTGTGTNCDVPFKSGETWLVYARSREGTVTTNKCTRTRLRAEAPQDLAYLEGLEQGRQQGIVYGLVLRRIMSANGQPALQALSEPLQVIAAGAGHRLEIPTDQWGPFQLVLPPGDFEIWVERAGRAVAPRQAVHVDHGSDRQVNLVVEYKD